MSRCIGYHGLLIFLFCNLQFSSFAQTGNCEPGIAEAFLDAGSVRARVPNNGSLFWNGSPPIYEVPKGDSTHAIFNADIWIAGRINNEVRAAASRYGPWEYWPGPLDASGHPPADCSIYDTIWEIRRSDLETFIETGEPTPNLLEWPWQLGAPVVDSDGILNNYNLEGGDRPELLGDQRLWWIMNDRGNAHEASGGQPIGLEVHASAFTFAHPGFIGTDTFYRYRFINKNTVPLTDAFFAIWTDGDIGNFGDDYIGSDSLLHLNYFYNADDLDEGPSGYGSAPPAVGVTILESPSASTDGLDNDYDGETDEPDEMLGARSTYSESHFLCEFCGQPTSQDYYNFMQARSRDGNQLLEGGRGVGDSLNETYGPTSFLFSGDPVSQSFWSEFNLDGNGTMNIPADRSSSISSGPFTIAPGDTIDFTVAFAWARGTDHLNSVTVLKEEVSLLHDAVGAILSPNPIIATPINHETERALGFDQNFPNPFLQSTTIRYSLPQSMRVRLAVYDVLGREVALLVDAQQDAGIYTVEFDAGELPAGLYLARIELDHLRFTKRMLKAD